MATEGDQYSLFELPETEAGKPLVFKTFKHPLWTENKARLIARYLYFFVLITRHGAYIDGFAGPQDHDVADTGWAAKLVLESEPRFLRQFWLCEKAPEGVAALRRLQAEQAHDTRRTIEVLAGDFNRSVDQILASGMIGEKTATFCLLDQRTFECEWETVRKLAAYKQSGHKIELFYFLGTGWLPRAFAATTKNTDQIARWWGRGDWGTLSSMDGTERAQHFCRTRFQAELGYRYAYAWPIYSRGEGSGAVMYHMLHATDHDEAPKIMARAYRTATGATDPGAQGELPFEEPT